MKANDAINITITKDKKHNGIISLWKFIYCLMIIIFHISQRVTSDVAIQFKYGAIGVEFFFLVSGYLLGKKALNSKVVEKNEIGLETWKYLWHKIKALYPYILITYMVSLPAFAVARSYYTRYRFVVSIWDLLFLQSSGFYVTHIIGVAWYISAMFVSIVILYPLILKYRKNFVYIIAPLISFFLWGYIAYKHQNLVSPWVWDGFALVGVYRAIFELSLGVILYELSEKIKRINFTKFARILFTIIEVIGFTSILVITNKKSANVKYDSLMLLILFFSICLAFSEKTLLLKYCNNKFFYYLEKLSLPMYLNQIWIMELLDNLIVKYTGQSMNFYMFCLLVIFIDFIVSLIDFGLIKFMKKILPRTKKIFINNNS